MSNYDFSQFKKKEEEVKDWLKQEYSSIRTGRAAPVVLDAVRVEAYNTKMPVNQLANVSVEDAQTLRVVPWDASVAKSVEKAINESDLGLSVIVDDTGLRVKFPELTSDRRESLKKLAKQKLEEARVSLKHEREEVWSDIQKKEKASELTEDDKFRLKDELQKLVDEAHKCFEEMYEKKEKEIGE